MANQSPLSESDAKDAEGASQGLAYKIGKLIGRIRRMSVKGKLGLVGIAAILCFGIVFWQSTMTCAVDGCSRLKEPGSVYCSVHAATHAAQVRVDAELESYQNTNGKNEIGARTATGTLEEQNALEKAKQYLSFTYFSASGLQKQLEYEGYSTSAAKYAVEHCGANWDKQAAGKAKSYMNMTSFSRSGLIEQLEYEGFTHSQAEYGVKSVDY